MSQPLREKMNSMAGSMSRSDKRSMILRRSRSETRPRPSGGSFAIAETSAPSGPPSLPKSRKTFRPTATSCRRGTGLTVLCTSSVLPRTERSHPASSPVFGTVADRPMSRQCSGRVRMTSSHTGPRSLSAR